MSKINLNNKIELNILLYSNFKGKIDMYVIIKLLFY